jgi:hypothetical protein
MKRTLLYIFALIYAASNFVSCQETCRSVGNDGECQNNDIDDSLSPEERLIHQAAAFGDFLVDIFNLNDAYQGTNRTEQEYLVLKAVLEHVGMNSSVLTAPNLSYNWYHDLFTRLTAMAPPNYFFRIYQGKPTDFECTIVGAMDHFAVELAKETNLPKLEDGLRSKAFRRYRYRGGQTRSAQVFRMVVEDPLKYWIGFAVPNQEVLERIAAYSPIVEVGAGTGYWSAALQQQEAGVDVIVYDSEPPSRDSNVYFHQTYTTVHPGTCTNVFQEHPKYGKERALLMVWPNNPDQNDHPESFSGSELPPTWDVDCLKAYWKAGGSTVIFVGERQENIPLMPHAPFSESGLTSTIKFQQLLQKNFDLVEQIDIPHWWTCDDATIWKRKESL